MKIKTENIEFFIKRLNLNIISEKKFKNIKPGTKNQDFFSYNFFEFKATETNTCERIRLNYGLMT